MSDIIYQDKITVPESGLFTIPGKFESGLKLTAKITDPKNWPNPDSVLERPDGKYVVNFNPNTIGDPVFLLVHKINKKVKPVTTPSTPKTLETKTKKQWLVYLVVFGLLTVLGFTGYTIWKKTTPPPDQQAITEPQETQPDQAAEVETAEKTTMFDAFMKPFQKDTPEENLIDEGETDTEAFKGADARNFESKFGKPLSDLYVEKGGLMISKQVFKGDLSSVKDDCAAIGGTVPTMAANDVLKDHTSSILWTTETKGVFDKDARMIGSDELLNDLSRSITAINQAEGVTLDKIGQKFGDEGYRRAGEDDDDYQERLVSMEKKAAGINPEAYFEDGFLYLDTDEQADCRCIKNKEVGE